MPRIKKEVSFSFGLTFGTVRIHDGLTGEALSSVARLLQFANEPAPDPLHQYVHDSLLGMMSRQKGDHERGTDATHSVTTGVVTPMWMRVAEDNLIGMVLCDGGWYLRRCATCADFFIWRDARKQICDSEQCRRAANTARVQRHRQAQRAITTKHSAPHYTDDVRCNANEYPRGTFRYRQSSASLVILSADCYHQGALMETLTLKVTAEDFLKYTRAAKALRISRK